MGYNITFFCICLLFKKRRGRVVAANFYSLSPQVPTLSLLYLFVIISYQYESVEFSNENYLVSSSNLGLGSVHNLNVTLLMYQLCHFLIKHSYTRYLAPEYFNDGNITEKADIYAFGLVLLELITGQRTVELQCYKSEHHSFSENIYPLPSLEAVNILKNIHQLLDPSLHSHQHGNLPSEVQAMGQAAFLCLRQDPVSRPPMSKVQYISSISSAYYPGNTYHIHSLTFASFTFLKYRSLEYQKVEKQLCLWGWTCSQLVPEVHT